MNSQKELSFKTVEFLRFPLIMIVVLIHCYYIDKSELDVRESAPVFCRLIDFLQNQLYSVAVPLFFFISGYLFFRNGVLSGNLCVSKLKKRVSTLLIPYLLWNAIGMLLFLLKISPWFIQYFPQYSTLDISLPTLLEGFVAIPGGDIPLPYDMSLWFVRNLIIVLAVSPLINVMFRYLSAVAIVLPVILDYLFPTFLYGSFSSMYFFMLGALLPVLGGDLSDLSGRYGKYSVILWFVGVLLSSVYNVHSILITSAGVFSFLYIGQLAVERGYHICSDLSGSTFFIYAFHALYISVASALVIKIFPPVNGLWASLDYVILFMTLAGGSFMVYLVARRLFPAATRILCGGR